MDPDLRRSMLAFLCDHWCLRSVTPPWTIDLNVFEHPEFVLFLFWLCLTMWASWLHLQGQLHQCEPVRHGDTYMGVWGVTPLLLQEDNMHCQNMNNIPTCSDQSVMPVQVSHPLSLMLQPLDGRKRCNSHSTLRENFKNTKHCSFKWNKTLLFLWSLGDCALSGFAQDFPLRECSSQVEMLSIPANNEFFQIEYLRDVLIHPSLLMNAHEQVWRFSFDGIKTSMEGSAAQYVVVAPKTGPMHTLSFTKHLPFVNYDHYEVV